MAITNGYASLAEFEEHIGDSRGKDGAAKERAIEASSRVIDSWTNRRFYLDDESSSRLYPSSVGPLFIDDFTSLVSVTPETSYGVLGTAYDTTTYRPGPLNAAVHGQPYNWIEWDSGWVWGTVSVEAIWGWPSVPAAVEQACLLMAARIYKRRESVTATVGFDEFAMRLSSTDPDVVMLLDPYRWITVG